LVGEFALGDYFVIDDRDLASGFGGAPSSGLACADGRIGDWARAGERFKAAHTAVTEPTPLREKNLFNMGASDIFFTSIRKS